MGETLEIGAMPGLSDTEIALTAAETLASDSSLPLPSSPLSMQRVNIPHLLTIPLQ